MAGEHRPGEGPSPLADATRRARIERRLETVVADHRVTIAVVVPVIGALVLLASAGGMVPSWLAFNWVLLLGGTAIMRLPLAAGLAPLLTRRATVALLLLVGYTYLIEFVGATTGVPYGQFAYEVALGPMLGGTVPLALPLFFLPLVLDGYLLADRVVATRTWPGYYRPVLAVGLILAIDLVLDPAAVAVGFWSYAAEGAVAGVPLSNFAGWLLSASVAVGLVEFGLDRRALRDRARTCPFILDDLVSFVLLWGVVVLVTGRLLSTLVAIGLLGTLLATGYLDRP